MDNSKILIVGLGYKGLSLALYLADRFKKSKIVGYDINKSLLNKLRKYKTDFAEDKVKKYLKRRLNKNFFLVDVLSEEKFDLIFICVGAQLIGGQISFNNFENAVESVAGNIYKDSILVIRRNLPVGFTHKLVVEPLRKKRIDIPVVFAPERTNRELALTELALQPQLIGANTIKYRDRIKPKLERLFPSVVLLDSLEEAEFTILCNNFHTYWLYAYGNVISEVCGALDLDTHKIICAANKNFTDRFNIDMLLRPRLHRPGYIGGSGLNIDLMLLLESLKTRNVNFADLITTLKRHNDEIPERIVNKCLAILDKNTTISAKKDFKIGIMGIAYKGSTPTLDCRFSLGSSILNILKNKGYHAIFVHDPVASRDKVEAFGVNYCSDVKECFQNASAVFVVNNHKDYIGISDKKWSEYIEAMHSPKLIFDTHSIINKRKLDRVSVKYISL